MNWGNVLKVGAPIILAAVAGGLGTNYVAQPASQPVVAQASHEPSTCRCDVKIPKQAIDVYVHQK